MAEPNVRAVKMLEDLFRHFLKRRSEISEQARKRSRKVDTSCDEQGEHDRVLPDGSQPVEEGDGAGIGPASAQRILDHMAEAADPLSALCTLPSPPRTGDDWAAFVKARPIKRPGSSS